MSNLRCCCKKATAECEAEAAYLVRIQRWGELVYRLRQLDRLVGEYMHLGYIDARNGDEVREVLMEARCSLQDAVPED